MPVPTCHLLAIVCCWLVQADHADRMHGQGGSVLWDQGKRPTGRRRSLAQAERLYGLSGQIGASMHLPPVAANRDADGWEVFRTPPACKGDCYADQPACPRGGR